MTDPRRPNNPNRDPGDDSPDVVADCPACDWTGNPAHLPTHIGQAHGE